MFDSALNPDPSEEAGVTDAGSSFDASERSTRDRRATPARSSARAPPPTPAPPRRRSRGEYAQLHHHLHLLALDGLYESHRDNRPLEFAPAPPPTQEQLQTLLEHVATRVRALTGEGEEEPEPELLALLLKVFGTEPTEPAESSSVTCVGGLDLPRGRSLRGALTRREACASALSGRSVEGAGLDGTCLLVRLHRRTARPIEAVGVLNEAATRRG